MPIVDLRFVLFLFFWGRILKHSEPGKFGMDKDNDNLYFKDFSYIKSRNSGKLNTISPFPIAQKVADVNENGSISNSAQ